MASSRLIQHSLISPAPQNIMGVVTSDYYLLLLVVFAGCLITKRIFLAILAGWVFVHGQNK